MRSTSILRRAALRALVVTAAIVPSVSAHESLQVVEARYPSGQLQSRAFVVNGMRSGLYETWWPSGIRRSAVHYRDDVFDGDYRTWMQNGAPYEHKHFVRGREQGTQQGWDERGTLYLNYVVRNGRRFGYANAKPCLPAGADGTSMTEPIQ
jgi:antitoxin component YwqK of YwqJK toxin-antitoxin module